MLGDRCVAIACDLRLGNQALTVNCDFEKVGYTLQGLYTG
jgi:20S proteasome subunit beta 3